MSSFPMSGQSNGKLIFILFHILIMLILQCVHVARSHV